MSKQTIEPPSPAQLTVSAGHFARVYPFNVSVARFPSSPLQLKHENFQTTLSIRKPQSSILGKWFLSFDVCARHYPTMPISPCKFATGTVEMLSLPHIGQKSSRQPPTRSVMPKIEISGALERR